MNLADAARRYSELGWALIPLDGKNPRGFGWQNTRPLDPISAAEIWKAHEGSNMGLVLGPSGVIDFELDSGDHKLFWELSGGPGNTPHFFTGSGKPHVLFRDPGGLSRRSREGFELRAGAHQSVLPPSIHPEYRQPYRWVYSPFNTPLADPPQRLLEFFSEAHGGRNEGNWREALRGEKLGKGQGRHQSLTSYMGLAVNQFEDLDQFIAASIAFAAVTQNPPYPDDEIETWALRFWDKYREEKEAEEDETSRTYLIVKDLTQIRMKSVEFVWKPWLQRAAFHLLVGEKGAGKGSFLTWLAARMTEGFEGQRPRGTLWIKTEDSFEIDVKPRFVAQGGDETKCFAVHKHVHLPDDLPHIRSVCESHEIGLVVIDPVAGVTGSANTNDEGAIIAAIGGLNDLANDFDLMVIGVRHLGKGYGSPLSRILGSVAWVNTPRAVLGLSRQEHESVLELLISNRVRERSSFAFNIEQVHVPGLEEPVSKLVPVGLTSRRMQDYSAG